MFQAHEILEIKCKHVSQEFRLTQQTEAGHLTADILQVEEKKKKTWKTLWGGKGDCLIVNGRIK